MKSGIAKQEEKKDIADVINTILDLQNNADMLTEASSDAKLKDAYHNHGIAHGYIRCLRDLRLLSESDYTKLFTEQIRISEMISNLQGNRLKEVNMIRGIVRNLDKLGRAVPPMEFRRALGIKNEEPVDMYLGDKAIRIRKAEKPYKGMVRETDHLGRVTLPIEYRRSLKMNICSLVDIYIEDGEICIRKATMQCVICGSDDEGQLMDVDGVLICRSCGTKVIDKFMED